MMPEDTLLSMITRVSRGRVRPVASHSNIPNSRSYYLPLVDYHISSMQVTALISDNVEENGSADVKTR